MRRAWSEAAEAKLRALYATTPLSVLAFQLKRTEKAIRSRAKLLGITRGDRHYWTRPEITALKRCYPNQRGQDVADALGISVGAVHRKAAELGIKKSAKFLASDRSDRVARGKQNAAMIATRFQPGQVPANKGLRRPGWVAGRMAETQFKKGRPASESRNYLPIGTVRLTKDGYLERKVTDDQSLVPARRWVAVHRLIWIEANGQVPPGHAIAFKHGQRTATLEQITLDRVECVSRAELCVRNSYHNNYPKDVALLIQLKGALTAKINRRSKAA